MLRPYMVGENNPAKRPEVRLKISAALKGKFLGQPFHGTHYEGKGEANGRWMGIDAAYCSKHQWISANYGKPSKCEICGTETAPVFHWHNLTNLYLRERSDYQRLCPKCHWKIHHPNGWQITRNALGQIVKVMA